MLLVFEIVFLVPVISRIESIGGGRVEGGRVGGRCKWGAKGVLKHPMAFGFKQQCRAFSICHKN